MDKRLYFVLGDLAVNVLAGAIVGALMWLVFGPEWNMVIAMFVAMALGMVIAGVLWIPASILFGAMEVMVPIMLSGMVSGMVVGMWASMHHLTGSMAFWVGAVCGLASIVAVWILNNQIRGPQQLRGEG